MQGHDTYLPYQEEQGQGSGAGVFRPGGEKQPIVNAVGHCRTRTVYIYLSNNSHHFHPFHFASITYNKGHLTNLGTLYPTLSMTSCRFGTSTRLGGLSRHMRFFPAERGQIFSIFAKNHIIVHDLKSFKSASFCFSKKPDINFDFGVSR